MPDSFEMPIISVLALTASTLLLICELRNNLRGVAAILAVIADIAMFIINFAAGKELIVSAFALILQCVVLLIAIQIYAKDKSLSGMLTPKQQLTTAFTTDSTMEKSECVSDETNGEVCAESAACENTDISESVTSENATNAAAETDTTDSATSESATSAIAETDTIDSATSESVTSAIAETDTADSATSESVTSAAAETDTSESAACENAVGGEVSDNATSGTENDTASKTTKTANSTTDKTVGENATTKRATDISASNSDSATHEKAQTDTARAKVTKRRTTSKPKKKGKDDAV